MNGNFERGLAEVGDGVHAYLQPDGSWGWSNAGLIVGAGSSLLVDTLFDLHLTRQMIDEMSPIIATAPIDGVANTHANGDHCYGNEVVAGDEVRFYASEAAAHEIDEFPPSLLAALVEHPPPGDLGDFVDMAFGPFDFNGIEIPPITDTFTSELTLDVGGRRVDLVEVGPAHTAGDVIAWVPDTETVFAGDILFIHGTPIMWSGPASNWIAACDRIVALQPSVVVPGHGPLTDLDGVEHFSDYLRLVAGGVRARHEAGMSVDDAWRDLDREIDESPFAELPDRERLIVTVHTEWTHLEPGAVRPDTIELFTQMALDRAARSRRA